MPNSINLTNLPKFKFGNNVTPTSPAVAHGSILVNTDDGSMFVDLSGNRIRITDIVHVANSSVLESITSPEPKIYMTDSTGDLYISKVSSGQSGRTWHAIYDEDDAGSDESSYYAVYDGTITPYEVNNTQQYATVNGQQYPIYTVNYTATVKSYGEDQTPLSGTYYLRPIGDPEMNIWGWGMVQNPSTEHVANSFAHWGEVDVNEGGVIPTDIPPHNGRLWNDDVHAGAFTTFDIGTAGGSRVWVNLTAAEGSVTPAQLQDVLSGYMRKNVYDSNSDDKVDSAAVADVANSVDWNNVQNKPSIPSAVTESTVAGWGFTKNTGTYSKPSTGIPKSDLANDVKTSLGKADSAVQSADLATVATSGSYNDLADKPNIPAGVTVDSSLSSTSENPVQNKVVKQALDNKSDTDHTHDYSNVYAAKDHNHNGVYAESSHSHQISDVTNLQSTLNDKISNPSSGNTGDILKKTATGVEWSTPAAAVTVDSSLSSSSENPVQNKVIKDALDGKSDTGHTHDYSNVYAAKSHTHTSSDISDLSSTIGSAISNKIDKPSTGNTGDILTRKSDGTAEWSTPAASVTVDATLSSTSENPVQNKVINNALSGKANSTHSHSISDVTDLQTSLNNKADSSHTHAISDVANLQSSLDGKAASNHTHDYSNTYAPKSHSHSISDVTDLQSTLNGKAASTHSHAISDVTNLQTTLNTKITNPDGGSVGNVLKKTSNGFEWGTAPANITVDSVLSTTSQNPVENRAITKRINSIDRDVYVYQLTVEFEDDYSPIGGAASGTYTRVNATVNEKPYYSAIISHPTYGNIYGYIYWMSSLNKWELLISDTSKSASQLGTGTYSGTTFTYTNYDLIGRYEGFQTDYYYYVKVNLYFHGASGYTIKPKLMLTVPVSSNNADLYLIIQKASSPSGTYTQILNTRTNSSDAQKMRVFNNGSFNEVYENSGPDSSGVGSGYANRVCVIDVESLMDLGDYYRYQWVTYSGSINNSDWSGGCYPSSNEQIANLADRVQNLENRIQVVNELPANPTPGILYLIPETE